MQSVFLVLITCAHFEIVATHLRGSAPIGDSEPCAPESKAAFDQASSTQMDAISYAGMPEKMPEEWAAHAYDHKSKIGAEERTLSADPQLLQMAMHNTDGGCFDDPMWRDADGDGCEIYRFAIESGKTTREIACSGGGEQSPDFDPQSPSRGLRGVKVMVVTDASAKIFCRATCGICQD